MLKDVGLYVIAALFEIIGCYAFLMAIKFDKSVLWYIAGVISLSLFAWALANVDIDFAGRSYAVYGGVYIIGAVMWLWLVDKETPTQWDLIGAAVVLLGTAIIFLNAKA